MRSRHLVDSDLVPMLAEHADGPITIQNLPALRAARAAIIAARPRVETPTVHSEIYTAPGPMGAPALEVRVYRPTVVRGPIPAFLFIHGGGYVLGSPAGNENENRLLVAELGCAIFAVSYRLAPETTFPGPLDDCYAALTWIVENAGSLGVDPARIGVKGDSAGGGLAAALAILARDRGGPALAFQHLIYPMIDDRTCITDDPHRFTGDYFWTAERNTFGWTSLLGRAPGGEDVSPYAAPARIADASGLPPTFLAVGALDLFLDENLAYARQLSRAGVPVELHVYPGAFHGFLRQADSRVARTAQRDSCDALRRALYP